MKNWKTTLALASMLLVLLGNINAQSSVWKIEGKGTTLFLGGTIHVLRSIDYPLPAEFNLAYSQSNTVVLEADTKKLEDPAVGQSIVAKSMYPTDEGLSKALKKETYEALKAELTKLELPIESLEQFKPSMVVLTMTMIQLQKMGITAEGVDKHFYEKAVADKKSLEFFETAEQQIDMITSMGKGNEDAMIMHTLRDLGKMKSEMFGMLSDWKLGESKTISKQFERMKTDYPIMYTSLLVDRNNAWMPQLEKYLDDKNVELILVGAAHLHGPDGLIKQMKNKGYTVTQVISKEK